VLKDIINGCLTGRKRMDKTAKRRHMPKLLMAFCSLKTLNHESILHLYIEHGIIHTVAGEKAGFETCCRSKHDDLARFFVLLENADTLRLKKDLELNMEPNRKPFICLPSEKESEELWNFLRQSQQEYLQFLKQANKSNLDLKFINRLIARFGTIGLRFEKSRSEWFPKIAYTSPYLPTIEDHIDWELLSICLHPGAPEIFHFIKQCDFCGKLYTANVIRKDQRFCSGPCRSKNAWPPEKRAEYMRDYKKNDREKKKQKVRKKFIKGLMANGYTRDEAKGMWDADQNM
jgi:hypothetical protein